MGWSQCNHSVGARLRIGTPELVVTVLRRGLALGAEWDVRKEAAWVVSNIATGGTEDHLRTLLELGAVGPVCELLVVRDARILQCALETLEALLAREREPALTLHESRSEDRADARGAARERARESEREPVLT